MKAWKSVLLHLQWGVTNLGSHTGCPKYPNYGIAA